MVVDKFGRSPRMHVVSTGACSSAKNKVNRSGDIMRGNLDMSGNRVMNVPCDPDNLNDAVSAKYVKKRCQDIKDEVKPIVTVWAEESDNLNAEHFEWSFGSGGKGNVHKKSGYVMMAPGRILRMSIGAYSFRKEGSATVRLTINGFVKSYNKDNTDIYYEVIKEDGKFTGLSIFDQPLELQQGDILNFKTITTTTIPGSNIKNGIVSVLIELDL